MTSDDLALLCHSLAEAQAQRRGIPIKTTSGDVALESAHEALDRAEEQLYLDPHELIEGMSVREFNLRDREELIERGFLRGDDDEQ